jgi:hypothetical protein|tara:strand:+ start:188 stop:412 length:225 start_codon:yes stop_codon:yes gene_type:complete
MKTDKRLSAPQDESKIQMNITKIARMLVSILFPVAALYFCWWIMGDVGELVAGIIFLIMTINYIWLMRKLGKTG